MIKETTFFKSPTRLLYHFGHILRKQLILAVVGLIIIIPLDHELLQFYVAYGVVGVLLLTLVAAVTSARHPFIILLDMAISIVMFMVFEYYAIAQYVNTGNYFNSVFLLRQVMALIFLSALYVSMRSIGTRSEDVKMESEEGILSPQSQAAKRKEHGESVTRNAKEAEASKHEIWIE